MQRASSIIEALKQRKLFRWLLGYVAFAWVALQITDVLREIWDWPVGLQRGITLVLGLGLFQATVIAWYHGEQGRQHVCLVEVLMMAGLTIGSVAAICAFCR